MWWNKDKKYFRLDVSPDLINFKREEDIKVYPVQKKKGDKRLFNFGLNPLIKWLSYHFNKKRINGKK